MSSLAPADPVLPAPSAAIPLRRRPRRNHRLTLYLALLGLVLAGLLVLDAAVLARPRRFELAVVIVVGAVAGLTRLARVGGWRVEAGAITPAFVVTALLLGGPAAAALVVLMAYAADAWRSGAGRPYPLASAAVQFGAVLAATSVVHALAPAAPILPWAMAAAAVAYWLAWQLLELPRGWVSGRADHGGGMAEALLRTLLISLSGVSLAILWLSGPVGFLCGLLGLVFLNRAVSSSHFGREALVEPKTGLFNSRYFQDVLESELDRSRRLGRPAAVLLADLDHLREINNRFGHQTGDAVIKRVAAIIRESTRSFDVPARFGGEEFAILLPETSKRRARVIGERLRRAVADEEFHALSHGGRTAGATFTITVSVGIAGFPDDAVSAEGLIGRADAAAYAAKHAGRNQVRLYQPGVVLAAPAQSTEKR
jgi:diguanylate cyclase (GGDEF)-like protein